MYISKYKWYCLLIIKHMSNIVFETENISRRSTKKPESKGIIGLLIKLGLAKGGKQANIILFIIFLASIIIMTATLYFSRGENGVNFVDPATIDQSLLI